MKGFTVQEHQKSLLRGERLHKVKLLKKKRSIYWGHDWKKSPKQLGQLSQTPANCNNFCCVNPRRFGYLTFKELIQLDAMRDGLNE